ncbi:MAG: heavy metal-responsive transcriptional regulator [Bacteroidetes bacterium]|nr:heavy metal-responsive transcriptional regulator [Bacteroidota bacterium]
MTVTTRLFTIGQLAKRCGVTPRAVRHYETLRLLKAPIRGENNYRFFDADSVERLSFIARCRSLGFSIPEIAELLRVVDDPDHTCAQIVQLTRSHLEEVDTQLRALLSLRDEMAKYLGRCSGAKVPECAVLDFLKQTA